MAPVLIQHKPHEAMTLVSLERFEELATEALEALPEWIRERMDNVYIAIEGFPPADNPRLLGLYQGVPLTQRSVAYAGLPDKITLFRSTIERGLTSEWYLREEIRHVLVHEVAHFMGISDQELMDMGRY